MKSSVLLVLLAITFLSGAVAAQTRARINFDLNGETTARLAAPARSRVTNSNVRLSAGTIEQQVFALINEERGRHGLTQLVWSESLAAVARMHSEDMANVKFFSHRGSDGSMVDARADKVGLGDWRSIGENIAYMRGFDDPAGLAVEKWLQSAAHRKNLLGSNWTESAVGVAVTEDGTYYVTEVFLVRR